MASHAVLLFILAILFTFGLNPPAQSAPVNLEEPEPPQHAQEIPLPHSADIETSSNDATKKSNTKPRIGLLHMHDGAWFFKRLGSLTLANKRRYASRWGYDIITRTPSGVSGVYKADTHPLEFDTDFDIDHTRAPTFGKLKLANRACIGRKDYWLLWTDADAMVINQTIPLESIIDDGYNIIFAYDWLMLNAGMLIMKCTDWTQNFLTSVYDARSFDKARALDQSSLQDHLDKLPKAEYNANVKVIPKYAMNVYLEEYRPGDFLMHAAGKLYEATEKGLLAIMNQFDTISTIEDVKDIEAFFNTKYLLNYYSGTCDRRHGDNGCKPDDSRRMTLNESLGSMSTPNRYRHVALRYHFLQNWSDKYEKQNWNVKLKSLPMPRDSQVSERQLLKEELATLAAGNRPIPPVHHIPQEHAAVVPPRTGGTGNIPPAMKLEQQNEDEPVSLDAVKQALAHDDTPKNGKDDDKVGDDLDEDSTGDKEESSLGIKLFVVVLFFSAAIGGGLLYRKRKRALKVQ